MIDEKYTYIYVYIRKYTNRYAKENGSIPLPIKDSQQIRHFNSSSETSSVFVYPFSVHEINKKANSAMNAATRNGVPSPRLELGTLDLKL